MLGFIQEHGPYVLEDGSDEFHNNEFSWNKEANVLYIESPAAVGYSYYVQNGDFNFTDDAVARDNLVALLSFFLFKFPER
jgi:carboxypeptidase C (cathepsin A)